MQDCAPRRCNAATLVISCFLALVLPLGFSVCPAAGVKAYAETSNIEAEADAAQQLVESSALEYDAAVSRVTELEDEIAKNEARSIELNNKIPGLKQRGGEALGELYKLKREGTSLIDLILSSESFADFITRVDYVDRVYDQHLSDLAELQAALAEQDRLKKSLSDSLAEAASEQQRAADALAAAQEAREQAQRAAQALAEEEARKAAEQAKQDSAPESSASGSESSDSTDQPSTGGGQINPPTNDNADWSSDKASFVKAWTGRIDAYLAGSPLGGQGATFAEAAWDYGVDPRFSPAISCVESSKGAACFASHNAWGWGSVSWGSWEEAIPAHVRGLARGYGYTVTVEGAKKYCPPNWEFWYNRVSQEMNKI